ncbi:MAG: FAD-binding oxidoreductase [Pseudomonadota bacterium]
MNNKNAEATLSTRRTLRFWGWGYEDEELSNEEVAAVDLMAATVLPGGSVFMKEPVEQDFTLPEPRVGVPAELSDLCSVSRYDRLVHAYGKSFADLARMFLRDAPQAPDIVAFPRDEEDLQRLLKFAESNNVAVIPFGGGTSVCGGVEAAVGGGYSGSLCIDMERFNKILEVDEVSRTARIQAGMFGPEIDESLKPYGLTLRHFPQSYRFSTIGGWVATRSGGHFATLYTHIDDLVESVRMVTPRGVVETRRLPGSGAGPSPDRMLVGSEGIFGIITEVSVRLQSRPRWKATATASFADFASAAEAVRSVAQAGLHPANCRLLDAEEAMLNQVSQDGRSIVVLGFESADHPVDRALARALELVRHHGGEVAGPGNAHSDRAAAVKGAAESAKGSSETTSETQSETAAVWKNAFIRIPYYRNRLIQHGLIVDTFETSITWERLPDFYQGLKADVATTIREVTGHDGFVSCRFTHVYPDGACVYITFLAAGTTTGDMRALLDAWCQIKARANQSVVDRAGTITHHHAVGRDHRSGYEQQMPELFLESLRSVKATVDPTGIMNPGVLVDPKDRDVGVTGALEKYQAST